MRIFVLLFLLFCALSCTNKSKRNDIIPRNSFKGILIKLDMVDSYYASNYNKLSTLKDTNYYNEVFASYGFNRAQFDSTFKYYTKNAKKFDQLCDEMINDLQRKEQELYVINSFQVDSASNLYKGKLHWKLPSDGIVQKIPFSIAIKDTGTYTINVFLKLLPRDHAKKPRLTAYFWYKDGTKEGHREDFTEIPYKVTSDF